jgi:hypothetical protein
MSTPEQDRHMWSGRGLVSRASRFSVDCSGSTAERGGKAGTWLRNDSWSAAFPTISACATAIRRCALGVVEDRGGSFEYRPFRLRKSDEAQYLDGRSAAMTHM